ncbi:MAG: type III pantothenate kinase [Coriobacteriaceae bacterium]|nr:type III pantothenate kinase [Coriobacteriaceae bacterium]
MLLAIDMGNTQTALGLFDGDELVRSWRMPTDCTFTKDEVHMRLLGYFTMHGLTVDAVDAMAFAGVVPDLLRAWQLVAEELGAAFVQVGAGTAAYTLVDAANPSEVGADRIANATAAATLYGAPSIVVDFGTATNVDVVDERGAYIGGAIAPGIRVGLDALTARAARLASVPLEAPGAAIGRNTVAAVQSGTVVGAAAMAEGLVGRIRRELGPAGAGSCVIATGGLAGVVASCTDVFDVVDPQLTLKGIREIWRRVEAASGTAAAPDAAPDAERS